MHVLIIGGGASGLMAAVCAAREGASVTVLEQNEKPGRKLLATGNGRCNFTNLDQELSHYHSSDPDMVSSVLQRFSAENTVRFFEDLGICVKNRNGWLYPASDQAQAILDVLLLEARFRKVKIKTRELVTDLTAQDNHWLVKTKSWQYEADRVIVCCGSCASMIAGSDATALSLAEKLELSYIPFTPALCPVRCSGNQFSAWSGVRVQAEVLLLVDGTLLAKERGEVQLTEYGISGIPVFQLSRFAVLAKKQGKKVQFMLDFLPDFTLEKLQTVWEERKKKCPYKTEKELLIGILPEKLISVVIGKSKSKEEILERIKAFPLQVKGQEDFGKGQVCAGGILLKELSEDLESKKHPGLYFAGEALDVDGSCGGYNLQWAWASGFTAAKAAAKENG